MSPNLCANEACSREARNSCSECSRYFCDIHILKCSQCQLLVCVLCKFDHDSHSPLHEEGTPSPRTWNHLPDRIGHKPTCSSQNGSQVRGAGRFHRRDSLQGVDVKCGT